MEKLLSTTKKQGGNYATNITANAQKIFSLAVKGYENIFLPTHSNNFLINLIQDDLSSSTNNRIYY